MDAVTAAELSTMIYFTTNPTRYLKAKEAEFKTFAYDTDLAFFRTKPNEVIVIFKGSCSVVDWAYNLKFWMTPFAYRGDKNIKVHYGMNEKLKQAFDFLITKIKPTDKVYFTGHSLGGCLSLLASYATATIIGAEIAAVYAFGAPPVGNGVWEKSYNGLPLKNVTYDFMLKDDWTNYLPLKALGYKSVGRETVFLEEENSPFPKCISQHLPWAYCLCIKDFLVK